MNETEKELSEESDKKLLKKPEKQPEKTGLFFLDPKIAPKFLPLSVTSCSFIDVPLVLEDQSNCQAHNIILSLNSENGQLPLCDCFPDRVYFCLEP